MKPKKRVRKITEADTCRQYVLPKLYKAGWSDDQIVEQKYFTDGRIIVVGKKHIRKPGKKADDRSSDKSGLLCYSPCTIKIGATFYPILATQFISRNAREES